MARVSKNSILSPAWDRAERASNRAARLLDAAGIRPLTYELSAAGAAVTCSSPEQAKDVARILGGTIIKAGYGYPANTVRCPK